MESKKEIKDDKNESIIVRKFLKYSRKQFPLSVSFAISIHKSQSITLSSVIVDIGSAVFASGQSYVALSRCKSLNGVYLLNLDLNKITSDRSAKKYDKDLRTRAKIIKK